MRGCFAAGLLPLLLASMLNDRDLADSLDASIWKLRSRFLFWFCWFLFMYTVSV